MDEPLALSVLSVYAARAWIDALPAFMGFDCACQNLGPESLNVPFAQGRVVTRATADIAVHIPPLLCMHPTGQRRKLPQ